MNIVGKLPLSRTWCVVLDEHGEILNNGYDRVNEYNYEQTVKQVEQAIKDVSNVVLLEEPLDKPEYNWNDPIKREKYNEWQMCYRAFHDQQALISKSKWKPLGFSPVFKEKLKFEAFARGRSSVTMNFKTEKGTTLSLGPKFTEKFIHLISEKKIVVDENGLFNVQFKMSKQGSNVYLEPYYEEFEPIEGEMK